MMLDREELLALLTSPLMSQLRKSGFRFGMRNADLAFLKDNRALLRFISYVDVRADQPELELIAALGRSTSPPFIVVVNRPDSWQQVVNNGPELNREIALVLSVTGACPIAGAPGQA